MLVYLLVFLIGSTKMASVNTVSSLSFSPKGRRGRRGGVDLTAQSKPPLRRSNSEPDLLKKSTCTSATPKGPLQERPDSGRSSVGSLRDLGELLKPATPRNSDSGVFSSNPSSTTPPVTRVDPNYINDDGSSDEELAEFCKSNGI